MKMFLYLMNTLLLLESQMSDCPSGTNKSGASLYWTNSTFIFVNMKKLVLLVSLLVLQA